MTPWHLASIEANDFLAIEPHLVERVRLAVAGASPAVHVLTAADLAGVLEARQHAPAVHVIYGGFAPLETRADGAVAKLEHTWIVAAAARNVASTRQGGAARANASALLAKAGAAVLGFRPPHTAGPMRLTRSPRPYFSAGFMYLPLAFVVETFFTKSTT